MSKSNTWNNPAQLDSDLLRTFLAVAASGSLSLAAARVYRSQSAVSLQIKQLERILGRAVFRRHARGVELTTAGAELQPRAQQVVDLLDETMGRLHPDALEGAIRIGIPDEYGDQLLARVIARFARHHPGVELSVRCGFSADFPQALADGDLDIAVHAVESAGADMVVLGREKIHWVTSPDHPLHELDPVPVALFDRQCWWRDRAIESLQRSGKRHVIRVSSESVTGITAAVSAGVAIGMLGEYSLHNDFRKLDKRQGFDTVPASILVAQTRPRLDTPVSRAMCRVLENAFGQRNRG